MLADAPRSPAPTRHLRQVCDEAAGCCGREPRARSVVASLTKQSGQPQSPTRLRVFRAGADSPLFEMEPVARVALRGYRERSRSSHALAVFQSRFTVSADTPNT